MNGPTGGHNDLGMNKRLLLVVVAGIFSICAAIVGVSSLWERALRSFLPGGGPTPAESQLRTQIAIESMQTAQAQTTIVTMEPSPMAFLTDTLPIQLTPQAVETLQYDVYCYGQCWAYDDVAQTMTWTGPVDGREDVWQPEGRPLDSIRAGYTAIFGPMDVSGQISACILILNEQDAKNNCDGTLVDVPAGIVFRIVSGGPMGGFRWCPANGYGYRTDSSLPCR